MSVEYELKHVYLTYSEIAGSYSVFTSNTYYFKDLKAGFYSIKEGVAELKTIGK